MSQEFMNDGASQEYGYGVGTETALLDPAETNSKTEQFEVIRSDFRGQGLLVAVQRFEENEDGILVASYEVFTEDEPVRNISGIGPFGEGTRARFVKPNKPVQVIEDIEGYSHPYIVQNKNGKKDVRPDTNRLRKKLHKSGKYVVNVFSAEGIIHL